MLMGVRAGSGREVTQPAIVSDAPNTAYRFVQRFMFASLRVKITNRSGPISR